MQWNEQFTLVFGSDPKDPQFIGALRVADGEELFLGIFMSCSAILFSDYICDHFKPQTKLDALGNSISVVDWGCLLCNFVSCVFVCVAYEASKLSPHAIKNNLLVLKFVSSFCGSISCFSAAISHTTVREYLASFCFERFRTHADSSLVCSCVDIYVMLLLAALASRRPARCTLESPPALDRRTRVCSIPQQTGDHKVDDWAITI